MVRTEGRLGNEANCSKRNSYSSIFMSFTSIITYRSKILDCKGEFTSNQSQQVKSGLQLKATLWLLLSKIGNIKLYELRQIHDREWPIAKSK